MKLRTSSNHNLKDHQPKGHNDSQKTTRKPDKPTKPWTEEEDEMLAKHILTEKNVDWETLATKFDDRNASDLKARWAVIRPPDEIIERRSWTPEEDEMLKAAVAQYGTHSWRLISFKVKHRTSKQCRERWLNNLREGLDKNKITHEEWGEIQRLHKIHGNKWSEIGRALNRSSNQIKNYWYAKMRPRSYRAYKKRQRRNRSDSCRRRSQIDDDDEEEEEAIIEESSSEEEEIVEDDDSGDYDYDENYRDENSQPANAIVLSARKKRRAMSEADWLRKQRAQKRRRLLSSEELCPADAIPLDVANENIPPPAYAQSLESSGPTEIHQSSTSIPQNIPKYSNGIGALLLASSLGDQTLPFPSFWLPDQSGKANIAVYTLPSQMPSHPGCHLPPIRILFGDILTSSNTVTN